MCVIERVVNSEGVRGTFTGRYVSWKHELQRLEHMSASYLCISSVLATNLSADCRIDSLPFQKWLIILGILLKKHLKAPEFRSECAKHSQRTRQSLSISPMLLIQKSLFSTSYSDLTKLGLNIGLNMDHLNLLLTGNNYRLCECSL